MIVMVIWELLGKKTKKNYLFCGEYGKVSSFPSLPSLAYISKTAYFIK
jgi:hypothetical protein